VEDFAVRRVEPGEELGGDEVQVERVAGLEEAGGEGGVVPGAVEAGHAGREAGLGSCGEVDKGGGGYCQGNQGWH
jgi:hypothetical protein